MEVGAGTRVTLHFALKLAATGEAIDSTHGGSPATFTVGDGSLPEGFERLLFGLPAGEEASFTVEPADAFGEPREENLKMLPRAQFDASIELEQGTVIAFDAPGGHLSGVVRSIEGDLVVIDFNHPLAGRTLVFDVAVLSVEPA